MNAKEELRTVIAAARKLRDELRRFGPTDEGVEAADRELYEAILWAEAEMRADEEDK